MDKLLSPIHKHTAYMLEQQTQHAGHCGYRQIQLSCPWFQKRDWNKMIFSSILYKVNCPSYIYFSMLEWKDIEYSTPPDFFMKGFPAIMVKSDFSRICTLRISKNIEFKQYLETRYIQKTWDDSQCKFRKAVWHNQRNLIQSHDTIGDY